MSSSDFIKIRPITKLDDLKVKKIILESLEEYGANREGFAAKDPELNALSTFYKEISGFYFVAEMNRQVVGGAGIAPMKGLKDTWELQKMYVSNEARGKGIGKELIQICIETAKKEKVKNLYIETLDSMEEANHLYHKFGFRLVEHPIGNTGHFGCDRYYINELNG